MKTKNPAIMLMLVGSLLLLSVFQVHAVTTYIEVSQAYANSPVWLNTLHPSGSASWSATCQSYTLTHTDYLVSVSFLLANVGYPTGTMGCYVYAASAMEDDGSGHTIPSVPDGEILEYSVNDISIETIGSGMTALFLFDGFTELVSGQTYGFVVYVKTGTTTVNASHYVTSNSYSSGGIDANTTNCLSQYTTAGWAKQGSGQYDATFTLTLSTEVLSPTAAPTPLPTLPTDGSYDTSDIDAVINTVAGYMIPLILFLLPAILLGYMTKWAMWPIIIGLAIGSGLTYLFLGTQYVWLVFLVACGIGGAIYKGRETG